MYQPTHQPSRALDEAKSRRIAALRHIQAVISQCYLNAAKALLFAPGLEAGVYVEGVYALDEQGLPFEHAWVEMPGGRIVDPTVVLRPFQGVTYWPGVRFTRDEVNDRAGESYPLAGGLRDIEMRRAYGMAMLDTVYANASAEERAKIRAMHSLPPLEEA